MNKEILNKTIEVEDDLIVITEETKIKKDRRQLDNELMAVQRQMANVVEQNKRMLEEFQRLQVEEKAIKDMIAQLPKENIEIIG